MSIRHRMLLAYSAMLLITILSIISLGLLVAVVITGDLKGIQQFYTSQYLIKPLTPQEESTFLDAKFFAKNSPEQLLTSQTLQQMDQKLQTVQSGMIVRKEDEIVYITPSLDVRPSAMEMPPYEMANIHVRDTFGLGNRFFTYVKFDFSFQDKSRGSIYVLKEISPYGELARKWFPLLIVVLLTIIILTNGVLNYLVSRSIIKPLDSLKKAAGNIKEGNLNFEVIPSTKDEIGQLSFAFEEMRRKLKESVELQLQYEENRKELLSNISHDLKTPITTIKGYVEGIQDGVANTPEKMDKYLKTIYSKAAAMDQLIDELFLFSKLDLKRVPFSFEEVEIGGYLSDLMEELHFDLEENAVESQYVNAFDHPVFAMIDREKLKRVVFNVIGNSVKYMDKENKCIRLILSDANDSNRVLIQVEDNGSGISPEAISHIFDRFYRAEQSRNRMTGGSGLGLAIAKQIVEEHGGQIWAESIPGKGTTIFFTLKRVNRGAGAG